MKNSKIKLAALALAIPSLALATPAIAAPAAHSAAYDNSAVWSGKAQHHKRKHHRGYDRYDNRSYGAGYQQQAYYGEPVSANTSVWEGQDGRYYCRKSNGTTGLLVGAAGGALLGRELAGRIGDRTLGAVIGAAGGALLGRAIDRSRSRCR